MLDREIAKILLEINAVSLRPDKPFRYASGILSPIYTDNRLLMAYPGERMAVIDALAKVMEEKKIEADVIAGTATAGIPHAAWLADKLGLPMIYVRKEAKEHGKQNQIEGILKHDQKVVLIEDLVSTGSSSLSTAEAIRNAGGKLDYCLCIFSYDLSKALDAFVKARIKLVTLTNLKTLVDVASENGFIKQKEKGMIMAWSLDPENWAHHMGFI